VKKIFFILLCFNALVVNAQTGIGTTSPDASAKLEVSSSNKGFLPPRVALTSTTSASPITNPATGLIVFNTATVGTYTSSTSVVPGYYFWNGSKWFNWSNPCLNMEKTEFTDFSVSATVFTLLHAPRDLNAVYMYINGVRITNNAYSIDPANNLKIIYDPTGRHAIVSGDRVQFDYQYCQ
jgi:hypothetical protein